MTSTPFTLHVPDSAIADLRDRLGRTRFPDQAPDAPWAYGTDVGCRVADMGVQVHGGMGFTDLLGLHYWFKRISFNRQVLGGPEICREEAARLQGFPDWFDFLDQSSSTSYKQLGNAVNVGIVRTAASVLMGIDFYEPKDKGEKQLSIFQKI